MLPFHHNPKLASRNARLHRLKRKGITPATDKAALRQDADLATSAGAEIKIIPARKCTRGEQPF